jgi:hypothetical protein
MPDGLPVTQECSEVDGPLPSGSNHVDALQILFGRSAMDRRAKPFD